MAEGCAEPRPRGFFARWVPDRQRLARSRWVGPFGRHLDDHALWALERDCVARAVAIGLFFGLLLPVAQFVFAIGFAIWLRAHVGVAAGATFITNPLTFAPIYWLAHTVGSAILPGPDARARAEAFALEAQAQAAAAAQGWLATIWRSFMDAGPALLLGLLVLAVAFAVSGFLLTWLAWPRQRPAGS